jgi:15-cis-phytoene synthase
MTGAAWITTSPRLAPQEGRAIIRRHSRSFSLASLLLGEDARDDAVALYAYCRRADDAVDLVSAASGLERVAELERELDDVYAGRSLTEPVLAEFQRLVFERDVPREYPAALLQGMRDDAEGRRYHTLPELLRYCWYVAGSVGGMMCHVLGVRRPRAVVNGVHLGMAMQLTNVCRDVAEDFERGRLYVPLELVPELATVPVSGRLQRRQAPPLARAVRRLLTEAEALYRSGDRGLPYLSLRSRVAVATARRVYSAIGARILENGADVLAGRAVVAPLDKARHVAGACFTSLELALTSPRFHRARLDHPLRFPEDVLPR